MRDDLDRRLAALAAIAWHPGLDEGAVLGGIAAAKARAVTSARAGAGAILCALIVGFAGSFASAPPRVSPPVEAFAVDSALAPSTLLVGS